MENKIQKYILLSVIGIGAILMLVLVNTPREDSNNANISNSSAANTSEVVTEIATEDFTVTEIPDSNTQNVDHVVDNELPNTYQDGVYTSAVNYPVPRGFVASIDVSIEIVDGVVSTVSSSHTAPDPESDFYQQQFDNADYEVDIIGLDLADVSLSRVGGASLTTNAFTKALDEIVLSAKS